jgi:predicted transcriptional regulator
VIYALIMSDIKENELGKLEVRTSKEDAIKVLGRKSPLEIMVEKATKKIQKEEDRRIFEILDSLERKVCG